MYVCVYIYIHIWPVGTDAQARASPGTRISPTDLGLRSGFDPPYLERPGRQLYQQGLSETRLGCRDRSPPEEDPGTRQGRHQGIQSRQYVLHSMYDASASGAAGCRQTTGYRSLER